MQLSFNPECDHCLPCCPARHSMASDDRKTLWRISMYYMYAIPYRNLSLYRPGNDLLHVYALSIVYIVGTRYASQACAVPRRLVLLLLFNIHECSKNIAIDPDRKVLVQSLVESHVSETQSFDDFVPGKGLGLVISLFGPPGVGSEYLKRPLYSEREQPLRLWIQRSLTYFLRYLFGMPLSWSAKRMFFERNALLCLAITLIDKASPTPIIVPLFDPPIDPHSSPEMTRIHCRKRV
ncbi:hypothetical protein B0H10DRAFT_1091401 [Mycena sp. CBHHK59/15]|nr:hypothetical protein B0H10DRAFT_1091401 [Mycena sp. CBHHK59/15]